MIWVMFYFYLFTFFSWLQSRSRQRTSLKNIFKRAGISSKEGFKKAMKQIRWSNFIEEYFPNPEDMDQKIKLHAWQKMVADKVQMRYYHPNKTDMKKYMQIIAPRSRGKSVIIGAVNAVIIIIENNNSTGVFSPSQQQSENIMSKTKYFVENSRFRKMVLPRGKSISRMQKVFTGAASVGLTNGGFSQAWANNEMTMRGGHYRAAFVDESARMSSHTMKAGIYPMVMRSNGPLVCISTPFGRSGPSWEAYNDTENWETIMVSAMDGDTYTPEQVQAMLKSYGKDQALARQEIMAEFISDDNAIFKDKYFEKMFREDYEHSTIVWEKIRGQYQLDLKIGKNSEYNPAYTYKAAIDYGWDTNLAVIEVGHWEEVVYDDGSSESFVKVDFIASFMNPEPEDLENALVMALRYYHVKLVVPDGQSVGVSELKRLRKRFKKEKLRVQLFKSGTKPKKGKDTRKLGFMTTGGQGEYSKINLVDQAIYRISRDQLRLPPAGTNEEFRGEDNEAYELVQEMRAFSKKVSPKGGSVTFGRGVNEEPDDRVLTLMYLIFAFSVAITKIMANVGVKHQRHPVVPAVEGREEGVHEDYRLRRSYKAKIKTKQWGR